MRFFKKRRSVEEQYTRYRTAQEAVARGALEPDSPPILAARREMLQTLGPAFDPTVRGWLRLPLIDPRLRDFMTRAIDPTLENSRDLDAYAEQILAIEALGIHPVTADVLLEVAKNLTSELASDRQRELIAQGVSPEEAERAAFDQALEIARRFLASTQAGAAERIDKPRAGAPTEHEAPVVGGAPAQKDASPCGYPHYLLDAKANERVGGPDMPRYCVVGESVWGTSEPHGTPNGVRADRVDGPAMELDVDTRLRYDQLDYSMLSNVGWHRFQILSGPYAGQCIRLDGPDMGGGDYAYLPDMPDELVPADVPAGEWEREIGMLLH